MTASTATCSVGQAITSSPPEVVSVNEMTPFGRPVDRARAALDGIGRLVLRGRRMVALRVGARELRRDGRAPASRTALSVDRLGEQEAQGGFVERAPVRRPHV